MFDVLREWLGEGGMPVLQEQAQARLNVCVNCRKNERGNWWDIHFKDPIAMRIRQHLEAKHQLNMHLENEEHTGMCGVCGCCIRLKAWTPLQHINDNLSKEDEREFPDYCWILKERL